MKNTAAQTYLGIIFPARAYTGARARVASASALFLVLVLTSTVTGLTRSAQAQDVVLDSIKAVVNEGVVLESDVSRAIDFFKQQARSNRQTVPPDSVLEERVLEQLIDWEVRRQHAADIGVAVDAGSINRAIDQIAQNNNMDTLQFRNTLESQGLNYDMFRENVGRELLMQRLVEREVQSRIRVTAQEIDDYIDSVNNEREEQKRYRIQHILLAVPQTASAEQVAEAEQRAQAVLVRLQAGDDFAEVAAASSDGARALQGGDLGWRTLQELPAFLSSALRDMQPGDLSEPLRSANGLHVVRLAELQSGDQTQTAETLARHIFIAGDAANLEQRLQTIRDQLVSGEAFSTLAAEHSEDPNSADNGGELPWFSREQMPAALVQVADALSIDEISRPFRTQFGWHILQVLERRVRDIDASTLREQAGNALRQGKVEQEIERWSRQLRDESFVEIRS